MDTISLDISGMSCGHCVTAVQTALNAVPGVAGSTVRVGRADVEIDPATASADQVTAAVVRAIEGAGYDARLVADTALTSQLAAPGAGRLPVLDDSCCSPRTV